MSYTQGGACPEHLDSFVQFWTVLCNFVQYSAILGNPANLPYPAIPLATLHLTFKKNYVIINYKVKKGS